jgi:hypothetical protein
MVEARTVMTVRENVHQLVDALPENRLPDALDYLVSRPVIAQRGFSLGQIHDGRFDAQARTAAGASSCRSSVITAYGTST